MECKKTDQFATEKYAEDYIKIRIKNSGSNKLEPYYCDLCFNWHIKKITNTRQEFLDLQDKYETVCAENVKLKKQIEALTDYNKKDAFLKITQKQTYKDLNKCIEKLKRKIEKLSSERNESNL